MALRSKYASDISTSEPFQTTALRPAKMLLFSPIIGNAVISFGLISITLPCVAYLVDAYTQHGASAMAATILLRNVAGTVLPLAGPPLYGKLRLGWGNSVLGFIALAFVSIPLFPVKFGERIRTSKKFEMKL